MRILLIAAALAGTGGWHYETTRDPLGQIVHVAEIVPDSARPFIALRLICGGMSGVVVQVNLGQMQFASMTGVPSGINFDVQDAPPYATSASLAPITDGVGTYEIKGSEAGNVAHLLMRGQTVTVREGAARQAFSLNGAAAAIGEVIGNCAYKI